MPRDYLAVEPQEFSGYMAGFSANQEQQQYSDQELVVKTLENKQKFAAIVRRYEAPLSRYIVRQGCKDTAMAQDLLQEVFIKAYLHLNDYDPALPFSSWIYRIAHNETVSHFRKEKNRPCVLDRGEDDFLFERIVDDLGLAEMENQKHPTSEIQAAVDGLESKYRDIIVLKFFEEKSYEEISDILQMPQGTVATLINRAKKKIKSCLEKK
ncbi:MAG TPA: RNA polymerase sigma factor [Chlorobaculum sp.]|nr:RNA polymerase sigma factor [Chlorobaculum sp.]